MDRLTEKEVKELNKLILKKEKLEHLLCDLGKIIYESRRDSTKTVRVTVDGLNPLELRSSSEILLSLERGLILELDAVKEELAPKVTIRCAV